MPLTRFSFDSRIPAAKLHHYPSDQSLALSGEQEYHQGWRSPAAHMALASVGVGSLTCMILHNLHNDLTTSIIVK